MEFVMVLVPLVWIVLENPQAYIGAGLLLMLVVSVTVTPYTIMQHVKGE